MDPGDAGFSFVGSEKGKEVKEIMRRMLLVLTAALVMVAMLAVLAAPTFASVIGGGGGGNIHLNNLRLCNNRCFTFTDGGQVW